MSASIELVDEVAWTAVYDGTIRLGHFITIPDTPRSIPGFGAFDADGQFVGKHHTSADAIDTIEGSRWDKRPRQ